MACAMLILLLLIHPRENIMNVCEHVKLCADALKNTGIDRTLQLWLQVCIDITANLALNVARYELNLVPACILVNPKRPELQSVYCTLCM